ncbi:MAG: transcription antitermination factor NusB, partial [Steroidobacteraceae bacterium]
EDLVRGVESHCAEIDAALLPYLDREIDRVDPIERAALRLGAYELRYRVDVPYRVVINEGVDLCKRFGATDAHKYVNAVLDRAAKAIRTAEQA